MNTTRYRDVILHRTLIATAVASILLAGGRLILLEDHVADLSKHRYLTGAGYRIIRRYENNGWYVPSESTVGRQWSDRWEVLRKYYLALPFRILPQSLAPYSQRPLMTRLPASFSGSSPRADSRTAGF